MQHHDLWLPLELPERLPFAQTATFPGSKVAGGVAGGDLPAAHGRLGLYVTDFITTAVVSQLAGCGG